MSEPPAHWRVLPLSKIAEIQTGIAKNARAPGGATLPYLRVANVQDGHFDLAEVKTISISPDQVDRYRLRPGDVLLTEGGDYDKLGRGHVWRGEIDPCLHQNHVFCVRANTRLLLPEFLAALTSSDYGRDYFLGAAKQTTNLASINKKQLSAFPCLVPPLVEQRRIVAALSSVDRVIQATSAMVRTLARVATRLVEDLVGGAEAKWPSRPVEELLVEPLANGKSPKEQPGVVGYPSLSLSSVRDGRIDFSPEHLKCVPLCAEDAARFVLRLGDLLVVRGNGNPDLVGRCGAVCDTPPTGCIFPDLLIRLRIDPSVFVPGFVVATWNSSVVRRQIVDRAKTTNGIFKINQDDVRAIALPIPPREEQLRLVTCLVDIAGRVALERRALGTVMRVKRGLIGDLLAGRRQVRLASDEPEPGEVVSA